MSVLVLNAGSSSLKVSVVEAGATLLQTGVDADRDAPERTLAAVRAALAEAGIEGIDVVGHRIVHGGERLVAPVL
ncbi:MAG: hypothetical protein IAG13_31365, partial [Deltaproteobacteria bacterium]|nr:hypothetical protein [Nannocystaceae bacterium]